MKMNKKRRITDRHGKWYRAVSLMLVMTLAISMLSGCGKKTENNETEAGTETGATDGVDSGETDKESSSALFDESLERLSDAVSSGSMEEAGIIYEEVRESLDLMAEEAGRITDNSGVSDSLSSDAWALLTERTADFKERLEENRTETEGLAEALEESIASGDADGSLVLIEDIRDITKGGENLHTYGNEPEAAAVTHKAESKQYENVTHEAEPGQYGATLSSSDEALISCTGVTALSDEMKELADSLSTPLNIYNYIKNNTGYEYYYGSRKGAEGTYLAMSGNDVDQASLLIAMLRYKGYPAMYVQGTVRIDPELAMSLTGADTAERAADVLASNGVPVTKLTTDGRTVYIEMEHVWVRTLVPYGNYRGAGEADGEEVWTDLDTGIKEYEEADSVYDTVDTAALKISFGETAATGDAEAYLKLYDETCMECEASLSETDPETTYVRKRIIKQKDEIYLPLSLQYDVADFRGTYEELPASLRDTVTFEVDGFVLAKYNVDELSGKNILLSHEAATDCDAEIIAAYGGLFSTPSYAAYMTPVLYVDGEAVSGRDEECLHSTPGSDSIFSITFTTKDGKTYIDNTITTGSMYAVTLDTGSIDDVQTERLYNEILSLAGSVTAGNVYSPGYMGRYLEFAGKLYFAELDLTYTAAADGYDIAVTRNLSEAITGYEVEKEYLYGIPCGTDFGHMYMDVDTDSHSVVSLTGDKASEKDYLFTMGIMGSVYESGIFEELTGEPAVSAVSVMTEAKSRGINILAVNISNMEEALLRLDTTDAVVSEIRSSVNEGYTVFIPEEDISMGGWTGTGYIILDAETGTGAYKISGGLNGGCTEGEVLYDTMVEFGLTLADIAEGMITIFQVINVMKTAESISLLGAGQIALAGLCIGVSVWSCMQTLNLYEAYVSGDEAAGEAIVTQTICDAVLTIGLTLFTTLAEPVLKLIMKNRLVKSLGADVAEELLADGATIENLSSLFKKLKNLGLSDDVISAYAKNFGETGLDFLRQAAGLNVSADLLMGLSGCPDLADRLDEILSLIKNSARSADEVAECIIKYGDDAFDLIGKYGDDAVDAIITYGDDAVDALVRYGDDAAAAIGRYGDDAMDVIGKYGDDAVEGLKNGRTPDEIRTEYGESTGGTIWDKITGTADNIPDTEIPVTFKIDLDSNIKYINPETGTNTLWTNSNATKHMGEYISRFGSESWSIGMRSQTLLESYSVSLNSAMEDLVKQEAGEYFVTYGNWELGINTATGEVYHARMIN